MNYALVTMIKL